MNERVKIKREEVGSKPNIKTAKIIIQILLFNNIYQLKNISFVNYDFDIIDNFHDIHCNETFSFRTLV